MLLFIGCAPIQPTFEESNQYFLERTIDKLNIGEEIKDKIPNGSKVAFVSIEENETLDKPIIAMIEDQMIQSLFNNGFIVVQRDADAIQKLIREGKGKYSLTYEQSTDGMMFEKVTGDMVKSGLNFVETQLTSADYVILYRILEVGILYRKDTDIENSDLEKREGLIRLSISIQGAQSGEIMYAANLTGQLEDKIRKEFIVQLATFHYSFFPYEYPLQPKKQIEALKEVKTADAGKWFILPRIGIGIHDILDGPTFGGSIGYGADSWGSLAIDIMLIGEAEGTALMLVYEKVYSRFLFQGGIGFTSTGWEETERKAHCSTSSYTSEYLCENANKTWYDASHSRSLKYNYKSAESLGLRLGVGYQFRIGKHFVIKPAYEYNLGFEENSGFSGINLNFGWK